MVSIGSHVYVHRCRKTDVQQFMVTVNVLR